MDLAERPVAPSDAVGESFRTGVMDSLDLGHTDVRTAKDNIVMFSSATPTPFFQLATPPDSLSNISRCDRGRSEVASYQTIRYVKSGHVGTLTLARPEKRNAQNPLMWQELAQLGIELLADHTLRSLVVAGDGSSFSAGIDLVEGLAGMIAGFAAQTPHEHRVKAGLSVAGTFNWITKLACPSIAAVQGHAYGAGLQLAIACDFRVFGQDAKVGLTETRYGILPDMGATVRLPRIVGDARARELILMGEVIDSAEALRIGLANRVVADSEVLSTATELALRLAGQPPLAIQGARTAMDAAWFRDPDDAFAVAVEAQIRCLESDDFKEAGRAMAEGRSPEWVGR
jgi:enoyl-CoA hydratase/carnithine racemase